MPKPKSMSKPKANSQKKLHTEQKKYYFCTFNLKIYSYGIYQRI